MMMMIEPEVKMAFCTDIDDIDGWLPSDGKPISYWLQVDIGPKNETGADHFEIRVASAEAMIGEMPTICRATMLVDQASYSFEQVVQTLDTVVQSCGRKTWQETAVALSRHLRWEHEDYAVIDA